MFLKYIPLFMEIIQLLVIAGLLMMMFLKLIYYLINIRDICIKFKNMHTLIYFRIC